MAVEKRKSLHYWWDCKLVQTPRKIWSYIKKKNIYIYIWMPDDPVTPLLGMYLKETKTLCQRDICTSVFKRAIFSIAKKWKQNKANKKSQTSIHRRRIKENVECYGMKHYSTIKKEILLLVTKCFDFECVILNERSQKKTNTLALVLCVEVFSFFFFFLPDAGHGRKGIEWRWTKGTKFQL